MFVRLQWLESVGRYETIFRDHPPTVIAFFAERVNLCKGEWNPNGTTATAYIWLVWVIGTPPYAPFWIPPGQREALTYPDDAERFTCHPVRKIEPAASPTAAAAPASGNPAPQPCSEAGAPIANAAPLDRRDAVSGPAPFAATSGAGPSFYLPIDLPRTLRASVEAARLKARKVDLPYDTQISSHRPRWCQGQRLRSALDCGRGRTSQNAAGGRPIVQRNRRRARSYSRSGRRQDLQIGRQIG